MAKKIEGSIHPTEVQRITTDGYEDATVYTTPAKGEYVSAVLVIGEKAFTESEVRAMLRDLLAASEDGPFIPNYDRMDEMVKFHGLSFDPA